MANRYEGSDGLTQLHYDEAYLRLVYSPSPIAVEMGMEAGKDIDLGYGNMSSQALEALRQTVAKALSESGEKA